jgi:AcrR family transcriptional regulator
LNATVTSPPQPARRLATNWIAREQVGDIQRGRILTALLHLLEDHELAELTIGDITTRARVSRKTLYDTFGDREGCVLYAFENLILRARRQAVQAYRREGAWAPGIRAALARVLAMMDEEPAAARLCLIETVTGGERIQARRTQLIAELATVIDGGRSAASFAPSPLTAVTVLGGACAVIEARLRDRDRPPLIELLTPLMSMIVLPYLGPAAAAREAGIAAPRAVEHPKPADPLSDPPVRLTYRRIRVLRAVAEQPGASNRLIADRAGIIDQGQISKLMRKLETLALIENRGLGQPQGAPNAWHLTPHGTRVERSTRLS